MSIIRFGLGLGDVNHIYEEQLKILDYNAVVGYDNLPITRFMDPPFTMVYPPKYNAEDLAAELLIDHIKAGPSWTARTIKLNPRLVIRPTPSHMP